MNINELRQRETAGYEAMDAILANPKGADGNLSADQDAALDELRTKIEATKRQIENRAFVDAATRQAPAAPINGASPTRAELRVFAQSASAAPKGFDGAILRGQDGSRVPVLEARHRLAEFLPPTESRASELALGGFLKAFVNGPQNDLERRVLAESSIGTGGAMLPDPLSAQVIDLLSARTVAFRAGAVMVPMTTATLRFVQVTALPEGGWRAENAPIVEGQPAFGLKQLNAHTWALLVRISRELLEDGQNTDATLQNVFATTAALALDQAILFGTGANNQPLGIANQPGIQSINLGPNGGPLFGWAPLLDAALALDEANAGNITAAVLAPRSARKLGGLVDTTGQPLQPPPRLAGVPLLATTSVPTTEAQGTAANSSSILLGDFSQVFVGMRTQLQVSVLQERYADNGQVGFVLWMRGDTMLAHPAAMAKISGITG